MTLVLLLAIPLLILTIFMFKKYVIPYIQSIILLNKATKIWERVETIEKEFKEHKLSHSEYIFELNCIQLDLQYLETKTKKKVDREH